MIQPELSLILGNAQYDSHVTACRVVLGLLPHANYAVVTLPAGVEVAAAAGDDGALDAAGDGEMTRVLTGSVARIDRRFHTVTAILADAGRDLARTRAAATYQAQDSGQIISDLAGEAGVDSASVDAALPLVRYAVHQTMTAAEHIAHLAGLSGCLAHVDAEGRLAVVTRPSGQPDLALLYGREFVDYHVREGEPPQDQLVLIGNGPAGNPSEPGAARHTPEPLPASAPAPGTSTRYVPAPFLKTPSAVATSGQARNTTRAAASLSLTARCFLLPHLRPGLVVQVQGLPDGIPAGPWLVTGVQHRVQPLVAGQTIVRAELADLAAFGLDALLAGALDLVGGLL